MFPADRDELRRTYTRSWQKYCDGKQLSPLEARVAQVIALHPEYHALLGSGEVALEAEFRPEMGVTNPYLHMGLHLAIREQVAIDRPPGVRTIYERMTVRLGQHEAEHSMLECLAETLWQAERAGTPPDDTAYLERLARLGI